MDTVVDCELKSLQSKKTIKEEPEGSTSKVLNSQTTKKEKPQSKFSSRLVQMVKSKTMGLSKVRGATFKDRPKEEDAIDRWWPNFNFDGR